MRKPKLLQIFKCAFGALLLIATCFAGQTDGSHSSSELRLTGTHKGWPAHDIQPITLPNGRLLISIGDSVYLLDRDGRQLWKYKGTPLAADPAYNDSRNELAIVMYDLQAVRLSAATGEVLWKADSVGHGAYIRAYAYGRGFLILVDMSGYQHGANDSPNRLEYWGDSEKDYWQTEFPKTAEVVVLGTRIYALHRGQDQIVLQEIQAPHTKTAK